MRWLDPMTVATGSDETEAITSRNLADAGSVDLVPVAVPLDQPADLAAAHLDRLHGHLQDHRAVDRRVPG